MEKLTIVKVGGKIVENNESLDKLLAKFKAINGLKMLVHGGGSLATAISSKLGIESQMVDGRRITDAESLKVVTMVYAGLVNKTIVAKLQALEVDAVGLTGADMNLILSDKRPIKKGIDYGFVGDVKSVDSMKLFSLINHELVPVFAPLTHDGKGNILNTNADTIASSLAKGLAETFDVELVFCFEKAGVLMDENDDNSIITNINPAKFAELKEKGIISGGMIPKLTNAFDAIDAGVSIVTITSADALGTDKGTRITV